MINNIPYSQWLTGPNGTSIFIVDYPPYEPVKRTPEEQASFERVQVEFKEMLKEVSFPSLFTSNEKRP